MRVITFQPKRVLRNILDKGFYEIDGYSVNVNQNGKPPLLLERVFNYKPIFCTELPKDKIDFMWKTMLIHPSMAQTQLILEVENYDIIDGIAYVKQLTNNNHKYNYEDYSYSEIILKQINKSELIDHKIIYNGMDERIYDNYIKYVESKEFMSNFEDSRKPNFSNIRGNYDLLDIFYKIYNNMQQVTKQDVNKLRDTYNRLVFGV